MGLGRRTTDPAAMETLKAIRQVAVSLGKGLPMEALAVAGNCLSLLESRAPLNGEQKEAVKQFLQTLSFNRVPLGPSESAALILRAEALVKTKAEAAEEASKAATASGDEDRVNVMDNSPEFKSVFSALRSYEDRLEMMQVDRSLTKMPKDQARAFLQAIQEAIQASRRRYANVRIDDLALRVLEKAKEAYRAL